MSGRLDPDELDVTPAQVQTADPAKVQVVDVREPAEWEAGRIAGARHIPMGDLASAAEELDRDRPVVFYCRVGGRSTMAATAFRQAGFDAHSMTGGLIAWAEQGRPLVPDGGTVADH